ncbi:hypothetical protein VKT23_003554 [Stygiomarasmius scandens]|uniref:F-box domain-containing protein n=1 Tax=Marasmiellus scandens TaxID=2682957 RepID=A0ABR1K0D5_9AGAR
MDRTTGVPKSQSLPLCSRCTSTIDIVERICPSTVHSQLRSRHQPSHSEILQIRGAVHDIESDLDRLDVEILSLRNILCALEKRREESESAKNDCLALFAPVRKLPTEILLNIFTLLCVDNPGLSITTVDGQNVVSLNTLNFSETCSYWRNITLSHPILWANIAVDLAYRTWNIKGLLDLYLKRSMPASLSLQITAFRLGSDSDDESEEESEFQGLDWLPRESWNVFRTLLDEMHRWQRVSFEMDPILYEIINEEAYGLEEPKAAIDCSFTKLEHIALRWSQQVRLSNPFFDNLTSALALQSFEMSGFKFDSTSIPIPFSQLTKATIGCLSVHEVQEVIRHCPRLKVLRLSDGFGSWEGHDDLTGPLIPCHSLESISISFQFSEIKNLSDTLSLLDAPNIRLLSLSLTSPWAKSNFQPMLLSNLKQMVVKSAPSLHELTLDGFLLTDEGLVELLPLVSYLHKLTLCVGEDHFDKQDYQQIVTENLFRALHMPQIESGLISSERHLVPNLIYLEIHIKEHKTSLQKHMIDSSDIIDNPWRLVDSDIIVSMLESRQGTLQHFKFCAELYSSHAFEWFESFEPAGLHWTRLSALHSRGLRTTFSSHYLSMSRYGMNVFHRTRV